MSAASPMAEACVSKTSRRQLVRSRNASVGAGNRFRSEEHTSELQHSQISYAVFCLKKKKYRQARGHGIITPTDPRGLSHPTGHAHETTGARTLSPRPSPSRIEPPHCNARARA